MIPGSARRVTGRQSQDQAHSSWLAVLLACKLLWSISASVKIPLTTSCRRSIASSSSTISLSLVPPPQRQQGTEGRGWRVTVWLIPIVTLQQLMEAGGQRGTSWTERPFCAGCGRCQACRRRMVSGKQVRDPGGCRLSGSMATDSPLCSLR